MPTSSRRAPPPAPAQPSRDLKSQSAPNKGGRPPKRQQPDGGFDAGGGIAPGHAAAAARPLHASPSQPLADMAAGVAAAPSLGVAAAPDPPGLRPLRKLRRNRHRLLRAIRRHRHQQRALLRLRQSIPKEAPVSLRRSPGAAAPPLAVGMVCPLGAWMPSSTIPCPSVCVPPPSLSHSLSLPPSGVAAGVATASVRGGGGPDPGGGTEAGVTTAPAPLCRFRPWRRTAHSRLHQFARSSLPQMWNCISNRCRSYIPLRLSQVKTGPGRAARPASTSQTLTPGPPSGNVTRDDALLLGGLPAPIYPTIH